VAGLDGQHVTAPFNIEIHVRDLGELKKYCRTLVDPCIAISA
jgi:hypothetical protein